MPGPYEYVDLERNTADQLDVSWLRNRAVPHSEIGTGRIVIERYAVAERRAVAGEVVIVQQIESFGAYLEIQPLFDTELLLDRDVGIAVRSSANAADTRAGAEVKPVEFRRRLEGGRVVCRAIDIHRSPRLRQDFAIYGWNTRRSELRGNT